MSKKLMEFASRKVAAFLAGLLTGIVVGGCSVFGPGIGASVYSPDFPRSRAQPQRLLGFCS